MRIAFLTSGGMAPCLSASIGMLIQEYKKIDYEYEFIGYLHGYKGLLNGEKIIIPQDENFDFLYSFGGSFIGSSRVKLTNIDDCNFVILT